MASIDTSYGLFLHNLRSMLYLERRLEKELGHMAGEASHDNFSEALIDHQTVTSKQVSRLEDIFDIISVNPVEHEAMDFKGIFDELEHLTQDIDDVDLLNVALLGAAMKIGYIERSSYNHLIWMTDRVDVDDEVGELLGQNLEEESKALGRLENISERSWFEKLIDRLNT